MDKFLELKHREQVIVVLGGLLALIMLLYLLVWTPLQEQADSLRAQNIAIAAAVARVDTLASRLLAVRESGGKIAGSATNISQLVNSRAARLGLKVSRLQPNSRGELQVRFEDVSFNDVLSWLHQLEVNDGLSTREVSITRASLPGVVSATVRVAAG